MAKRCGPHQGSVDWGLASLGRKTVKTVVSKERNQEREHVTYSDTLDPDALKPLQGEDQVRAQLVAKQIKLALNRIQNAH